MIQDLAQDNLIIVFFLGLNVGAIMNADSDQDDQFENWDQLRDVVTAEGGVLRVVMWKLRELAQAGRLGVQVRANISRTLLGLGLGHLGELPSNHQASVVLYNLGTPVAAVIEAIKDGNPIEAERELRRLNTSRDTEKLQSVAEKVEELHELING